MSETITAALLKAWPLPQPPKHSDKDARGRVLTIAGGAQVPGAAILCSLGALRAGAGKLQMAACAPWAINLAMTMPEARVVTVPGTADGEFALSAARPLIKLAGRVDAVIIGPGMIDDAVASPLAARLVSALPEPAFVLDAGAITGLGPMIAQLAAKTHRLVLTPHAGEMAQILGCEKEAVLDDPLGCGRRLADALKAVVVVKGQISHIVAPGGQTWTHDGGSVGLGTSGSGDVLAGVIGGLLARGAVPAQAAVWGVTLHGMAGSALAGRIGPLGFLAREILDEIPRALADVG
ncbi:MAG: NAD(P)H-hydrate dehydratase [Caulobacter sp.]|nr:NAD(P)H-hydrate dehydratase [Caulobacter sp.]